MNNTGTLVVTYDGYVWLILTGKLEPNGLISDNQSSASFNYSLDEVFSLIKQGWTWIRCDILEAKRFICHLNNCTNPFYGVKIQDELTGTLSDIGGFSLNYHKHIHTGEGGVLVTNDDILALKLKLIRNHGEASVGSSGLDDITNILEGNYRLGEIEAAIGRIQLKKLQSWLQLREKIVGMLFNGLSSLRG